MAAEFPPSLPGPIIGSMNWELEHNVIRSKRDSGKEKRRRRFTHVGGPFRCEMLLTEAQYWTLEEFYRVTLREVLPFTWTDWRWSSDPTGLVDYEFLEPPSHKPWGENPGMFIVTLSLQRLTDYTPTFLLDIEGEGEGYST